MNKKLVFLEIYGIIPLSEDQTKGDQKMKKLKNKNIFIPLIAAAAVLLLCGIAVGGYFLAIPHFTFTVMEQGTSVTVKSWDRQPDAVLEKLNITLKQEDIYRTEKTKQCTEITIVRAQEITVTVKGETQILYTQGETVEQLLKNASIGTEAPWQVSVALDQQTADGMQIQVDYVEEKPYSAVEEIPFEIMYCKDPSMAEGEEEIYLPGIPGKQEHTGTAVYVNDRQESVTVAQTEILSEPTKQIVIVGTGEKVGQPRKYPLVGDDFLITAEGKCLYYSRVEVFTATAYTSWYKGTTGTNYCGTPARVGAVAVDPSVIPYYTQMYIVSEDGVYVYGEASAEDCGSSIKGKIIDLFYDTPAECYAFGRRKILVYFLSEEPV